MSVTANINALFYWDDKPPKSHIFKVEGNTVREVLWRIAEKNPKLKPQLLTADGDLAQTVNIYVNRSFLDPKFLEKPVKDGDEIRVTPGGG